jgi:hypothetical protein
MVQQVVHLIKWLVKLRIIEKDQKNKEAALKACLPPAPKGGLNNNLIFNKSPLGDLGAVNKKGVLFKDTFKQILYNVYYPFNLSSVETVSFFLPFALRVARTLLPLGVDILSLKPCLFALFLLDG